MKVSSKRQEEVEGEGKTEHMARKLLETYVATEQECVPSSGAEKRV